MGANEIQSEYDKKLDDKIAQIKECQEKHNVDSCLKCDQTIGCTTRSEYVTAVYNSMNEGKSGGFEF